MRMNSFLRYRILTILGFFYFVSFGSVAHAQIYFMSDSGTQRGALDVSDSGQNAGKVVVVGADGKEVTLGGGSCGTLCAVLTAKIENGKAFLAPAVPDVEFGSGLLRFKTIFSETINAKVYELVMATPELATAAVGRMLGIVSADGANAVIGLTDSKDARTDVLVTDMVQAKNDIAMLKAQLASVQAALAMRAEESNACRSETIPVVIVKTVGAGDWVVVP